MNETNVLQMLIQGGLASGMLVSLWIIYKLASNHMNHSTDALNNLTVVIGQLKQFLEDHHDKTK